MEVDTGAAVSLMSRIVQEKLFPQASLQKSATTLRTYTGEAMRFIEELQMIVTYGNQTKTLTMYIVPGNGPTCWIENGCNISDLM